MIPVSGSYSALTLYAYLIFLLISILSLFICSWTMVYPNFIAISHLYVDTRSTKSFNVSKPTLMPDIPEENYSTSPNDDVHFDLNRSSLTSIRSTNDNVHFQSELLGPRYSQDSNRSSLTSIRSSIASTWTNDGRLPEEPSLLIGRPISTRWGSSNTGYNSKTQAPLFSRDTTSRFSWQTRTGTTQDWFTRWFIE